MTSNPADATLSTLTDLVSSLRNEVQALRTELETLKRTTPSLSGSTPATDTSANGDGSVPVAKRASRSPRPPSGELAEGTYEIVFDGGSLGNPGKGYGSYILFGSGGSVRRQKLDYADRGNQVTNNQAEYLTLIGALESLRDQLGVDAKSAAVSIWGDSSLVVNQVNGTWKVKNAELQPLVQAAKQALASFGTWSIRWHDRAKSVRFLGH